MIVQTIAREPYMRERRIKDAHGRILRSEFICYAYIDGKSKRLCAWDTHEEACEYLRALGRNT
jgi:hypothetical protein